MNHVTTAHTVRSCVQTSADVPLMVSVTAVLREGEGSIVTSLAALGCMTLTALVMAPVSLVSEYNC